MTNRFVCTKCRKNISEAELAEAKVVRTRYDGRIHTYCPICDNHIVSIRNDVYDKCITNLSKQFMKFGCRLICYYEGEINSDTKVVEYHPPIFRIVDNDKYFYNIVMRLRHMYEDDILADMYVIDEEDGSFSIIIGTETWYFDIKTAKNDRGNHLNILKRIISILIKCGKKYHAEVYHYE